VPPLRSGAFRSRGLQRQCRWEAGGVAAMGRTSDFFALPSTEGRASAINCSTSLEPNGRDLRGRLRALKANRSRLRKRRHVQLNEDQIARPLLKRHKRIRARLTLTMIPAPDKIARIPSPVQM